jgi:hypothetical protein
VFAGSFDYRAAAGLDLSDNQAIGEGGDRWGLFAECLHEADSRTSKYYADRHDCGNVSVKLPVGLGDIHFT